MKTSRHDATPVMVNVAVINPMKLALLLRDHRPDLLFVSHDQQVNFALKSGPWQLGLFLTVELHVALVAEWSQILIMRLLEWQPALRPFHKGIDKTFPVALHGDEGTGLNEESWHLCVCNLRF